MANVASLPIMLKELKLAGFTQHWEDLAQKALDEQWLPQQYLAELCAQETSVRCHRRLQRYLRESQLPPAKQLSRFDFADAQGITKAQIMALVQQTYWVKHPGTGSSNHVPCKAIRGHVAGAGRSRDGR
jgi:DNA replication protein DnaC